jgi:hypothetical protein
MIPLPDTPAPGTPTLHRIIIAASCYADATCAIPMAAGLAQWAGTDLHGILVEQVEALAMVGMFSARLITPTGAQVAAPTLPQMRRSLAADARNFKAELARLSRANQRGWTFERLQGDFMARLRATVEKADVLFVGHQAFYRHLGAVILIHSPRQTQRRTFDIASELARSQNAPLFVCATATGPEQRHLASVELETMLHGGDISGSIAHVFASPAELLDRINRASAVAVVVDTQASLFRSDADMGLLLDVARCPLVIVGSGDESRSDDPSVSEFC